MSYQALARKWRPKSFSELVGQPHVVSALSHQLNTNTLHHAYLFTGTRGVGKTTIARLLAKSLNCMKNGVSANPCCECENCLDLDAGKFIDLIEVDAASRTGVDDTRELIESVSYLPAKGTHKVYLIDEVHMFSKSSFNALLKTLEEPPPYVKFVLATTDPEKLPITVLSRCLQFNLKRYPEQAVYDHLVRICTAEGIGFDALALHALAKAGDGSMRDTLSLTDQALAFGQGELRIEEVTLLLGTVHPADIDQILLALLTRNSNKLFANLKAMTEFEVDCEQFLVSLLSRIRQCSWQAEDVTASLTHEVIKHADISSWVLALKSEYRSTVFQLWYDIGQKSLALMPKNHDPFGLLEMTLLRMIAFTPRDAIDQKVADELQQKSADIKTDMVSEPALEPDKTKAAEVESEENGETNRDTEQKKSDEQPDKDSDIRDDRKENVKKSSITSAEMAHKSDDDLIEVIKGTPKHEESENVKDKVIGEEVMAEFDAASAQSDSNQIKEVKSVINVVNNAATLVDAEADFVANNDISLADESESSLSGHNSDTCSVMPQTTATSEENTEIRQHLSSDRRTYLDSNSILDEKPETKSKSIVDKADLENNNAEKINIIKKVEQSLEWSELIDHLQFSAYEQALFEVGVLNWQSEDHAIFIFDQELEVDVLASKEILKAALTNYFNRDITLEIQSGDTEMLKTSPANIAHTAITKDMEKIKSAFFRHPIVVDIMTNLSAKLAAEDITLLNKPND